MHLRLLCKLWLNLIPIFETASFNRYLLKEEKLILLLELISNERKKRYTKKQMHTFLV